MRVVSATPRNVMGNVLSELSNDVLAHMPKKSYLARNLLTYSKIKKPKSVDCSLCRKKKK
jgi:hypothetical protein